MEYLPPKHNTGFHGAVMGHGGSISDVKYCFATPHEQIIGGTLRTCDLLLLCEEGRRRVSAQPLARILATLSHFENQSSWPNSKTEASSSPDQGYPTAAGAIMRTWCNFACVMFGKEHTVTK